MNPNKGKGKGITWLKANVGYADDACLIWPYFRNRHTGYALFGYLGKMVYAHRWMCEATHGPAPSPKHEVAHSCGGGHLGCVNPLHVSWKTKSENMLDSVRHGTHRRNRHGPRGRLKPLDVERIRRLRGKLTQQELGDMFGVSDSTIRDIYRGHTHKRVTIGD